jgi:integrase
VRPAGAWQAGVRKRDEVRQAYRLLSQIMSLAVDNGLIPASPCRGVRLPRLPAADPRTLTADQVNRLAGNCAPLGDRVLVLLLAYGDGSVRLCRSGAGIWLLTAHGVVIAEAVTELPGGPMIVSPKNRQRRELAVPAFVISLVRQHLISLPDDSSTFAFPGRQNIRPIASMAITVFSRRFVQAVNATCLGDVTPHDLRATHATWVSDSHGCSSLRDGLGIRMPASRRAIAPDRPTGGLPK